MSKKRMRNTGLFTTGLFLTIAIISVAATNHFIIPGRTFNDSTVRQLSFDTVSLELTGIEETDSFTIPAIKLNKQAHEYTESYIAENREILQKIQQKSATPFRIIDGVFSKYGLPLELKYLAV